MTISGVVAAYVMFHGNGAIESKLHQLLAETGYTCDTMGGSPSDDNYVIARVSPAYQGSNFLENPALLISGIVGILLIMITGYLIIYNIFQISVIQDIQPTDSLKLRHNKTTNKETYQQTGYVTFLYRYSIRLANWFLCWTSISTIFNERHSLCFGRRSKSNC